MDIERISYLQELRMVFILLKNEFYNIAIKPGIVGFFLIFICFVLLAILPTEMSASEILITAISLYLLMMTIQTIGFLYYFIMQCIHLHISCAATRRRKS